MPDSNLNMPIYCIIAADLLLKQCLQDLSAARKAGVTPDINQLACFLAMSRNALDKAQKEMKERELKTSNLGEEEIFNYKN